MHSTLSSRNIDASRVSDINRRFYDVIATKYDRIDSRRNRVGEFSWLESVVQKIRALAPAETESPFLDAGAGTALLGRMAQPYFSEIVLLDISDKMLAAVNLPAAKKVVGDCSSLPFESETFAAIGAFATLHHLYDPSQFFSEAWRTLKPGGILYTDHDISSIFVDRWHWPLKAYRKIFDHWKGYSSQFPELTLSDYKTTEYHGDTGIPVPQLRKSLIDIGFSVLEEHHHWEGMGPVGRLVGALPCQRQLCKPGVAPVVRWIAQKPARKK